MNLIPKKYFLFVLAALLVVALGIMAVNAKRIHYEGTDKMYSKELNELQNQSESNDLDSVEVDLNSTDYSGIDSDIEMLDEEFSKSE